MPEHGQGPVLWFRPEGTQKGTCTGLGMAGLINFGGLGEGAVHSSQTPDSAGIRAGDGSPGVS